ncbi:hypothetical protein EDD11_006794 [Mortierella claussenii]|nr:hypothetical protein EDD11_006794 [Mortierella claussenii]
MSTPVATADIIQDSKASSSIDSESNGSTRETSTEGQEKQQTSEDLTKAQGDRKQPDVDRDNNGQEEVEDNTTLTSSTTLQPPSSSSQPQLHHNQFQQRTSPLQHLQPFAPYPPSYSGPHQNSPYSGSSHQPSNRSTPTSPYYLARQTHKLSPGQQGPELGGPHGGVAPTGSHSHIAHLPSNTGNERGRSDGPGTPYHTSGEYKQQQPPYVLPGFPPPNYNPPQQQYLGNGDSGAGGGDVGTEGHYGSPEGWRSGIAPSPSLQKKPKELDKAVWVGNVLNDTTMAELQAIFEAEPTEAEGDIEHDIPESIFILSKSNCAFVNYSSHEAVSRAVRRFHDREFKSTRLVCRPRKDPAAAPDAFSTKSTSSASRHQQQQQQSSNLHRQQLPHHLPHQQHLQYYPGHASYMPDISSSSAGGMGYYGHHDPHLMFTQRMEGGLGDDHPSHHGSQHHPRQSHQHHDISDTQAKVGRMRLEASPMMDSRSTSSGGSGGSGLKAGNGVSKKSRSTSSLGYTESRYFILKSLNEEDLKLSVQYGLWATQDHLVPILNEAFASTKNVYLVFSANKSGEFFGYARMMDVISTENETAITSGKENEIWQPAVEMPLSPEMKAAMLEEIEQAAKEGRKITNEEAEVIARASTTTKSWGIRFPINWIHVHKVPFSKTTHMLNPLYENREIKVSKDGTEVDPSVGEQLLNLFKKSNSSSNNSNSNNGNSGRRGRSSISGAGGSRSNSNSEGGGSRRSSVAGDSATMSLAPPQSSQRSTSSRRSSIMSTRSTGSAGGGGGGDRRSSVEPQTTRGPSSGDSGGGHYHHGVGGGGGGGVSGNGSTYGKNMHSPLYGASRPQFGSDSGSNYSYSGSGGGGGGYHRASSRHGGNHYGSHSSHGPNSSQGSYPSHESYPDQQRSGGWGSGKSNYRRGGGSGQPGSGSIQHSHQQGGHGGGYYHDRKGIGPSGEGGKYGSQYHQQHPQQQPSSQLGSLYASYPPPGYPMMAPPYLGYPYMPGPGPFMHSAMGWHHPGHPGHPLGNPVQPRGPPVPQPPMPAGMMPGATRVGMVVPPPGPHYQHHSASVPSGMAAIASGDVHGHGLVGHSHGLGVGMAHGMEGMVPLIGYDGMAYAYIPAEETYHQAMYGYGYTPHDPHAAMLQGSAGEHGVSVDENGGQRGLEDDQAPAEEQNPGQYTGQEESTGDIDPAVSQSPAERHLPSRSLADSAKRVKATAVDDGGPVNVTGSEREPTSKQGHQSSRSISSSTQSSTLTVIAPTPGQLVGASRRSAGTLTTKQDSGVGVPVKTKLADDAEDRISTSHTVVEDE